MPFIINLAYIYITFFPIIIVTIYVSIYLIKIYNQTRQNRMVKYINIAIDDDKYEQLKKVKGDDSWKAFILTLLPQDKKEDEKKK